MKKVISMYCKILILMLFVGIYLPGNIALGQKGNGTIKIGTYDSRVIIFAYSRSDFFKEHQLKFKRQSDSAEKVHDTAMIKELGVQAMSYQHLLHQEIFSTGTVCDIIKLVADKLPELAKKEELTIIVSKFELPYKDPSAVMVDVTDQVAQLFKPLENIDKMVSEIRKAEAIPLEELSIETDMLDLYCKRFGKK